MTGVSVLGPEVRSPAGTKLVEEGELRTLLIMRSTDVSPARRRHTQLKMQVKVQEAPVCGCIRSHPTVQLLRAPGWP